MANQIVLSNLVTLTCDGEHVSSVYGCVKDGVLCDNAGQCQDNACKCNSTRQGEFCEDLVSSSSGSSDLALPIVLGRPSPLFFVRLIVIVLINLT
jgi:hypothetical protein